MISGDNKLRKQELSELDLIIISNVMELYHRAVTKSGTGTWDWDSGTWDARGLGDVINKQHLNL